MIWISATTYVLTIISDRYNNKLALSNSQFQRDWQGLCYPSSYNLKLLKALY
jgi:hypothetical protein